MDDDVIAGGSSSEFLLAEPKDQAEARLEERDNVLQAYPVIQARIDQLKQRIDHYRSIDAIPELVLTAPDVFIHVVAGNKERVAALREELAVFESLIKEHLTPQ